MNSRQYLDSLVLNVIAEMRRQQKTHGRVLPVRKKREKRERIDLSRFWRLHNVEVPRERDAE